RARVDPGPERRIEQVGRLDQCVDLVLLERIGVEAVEPQRGSGTEDEHEPSSRPVTIVPGTALIGSGERIRHRSASSSQLEMLEGRLQVVAGELTGMQVTIEEISGVAAQSFPFVRMFEVVLAGREQVAEIGADIRHVYAVLQEHVQAIAWLDRDHARAHGQVIDQPEAQVAIAGQVDANLRRCSLAQVLTVANAARSSEEPK